jgi:CDP-glucose 4,6-dehydratase
MRHKNIKGKKILITGVTGFIGRHLRARFENLGASVVGISQSTTAKNIVKGNILYKDLIDDVLVKYKIHQIYHLAGESLVEGGQSAPFQTFKVNIQGTLNILESAREHKLERVIITSTSHVYGRNRIPYYEGYTPKPTRPYETSKACTDLLAQSYADTFKLPVLIPRFVNVYGPGDLNFNRVIPKIMKGVYRDENLRMWGGDARRDYLYIEDAVNALVQMGKYSIAEAMTNRIFNFGSGNVISVKDLLHKILLFTKREIPIERIGNPRPDEIKAQYVSFKKAERILGWSPKVDIDSGLKMTIAWYKEYFKA